MNGTDTVLSPIKEFVRKIMRVLAKSLNHLSGGKLTPNTVTAIGLLAHIPIAVLIAQGYNVWAAVLLLIFGLFDTLDGELARLQHKDNPLGMFLDSSTDRVKEIMLYAGIAYAIVAQARPYMAVWVVIALGISMFITYINAWGEVTVTRYGKRTELNKTFRGGLMGFEVRMVIIILGLLADRIIFAVVLIVLLGAITALQRFQNVINKLQ